MEKYCENQCDWSICISRDLRVSHLSPAEFRNRESKAQKAPARVDLKKIAIRINVLLKFDPVRSLYDMLVSDVWKPTARKLESKGCNYYIHLVEIKTIKTCILHR